MVASTVRHCYDEPMRPRVVFVTAGSVIGRLTVVREKKTTHEQPRRLICSCACGNKHVETSFQAFRKGQVKSCGCLKRELFATANFKHGRCGTPEYNSWMMARRRCDSPKATSFANYGGRGITMCDRWRNSFESFYADMGPRPSKYTLERIDNDKGYSPDNCRWATRSDQLRNTRRTRKITFNGVTQSVADWATDLGIDRRTLYNRLNVGWPIHDVLSTPVLDRSARRTFGKRLS